MDRGIDKSMVTPALAWASFDVGVHCEDRRVRRRLAKAAETPLDSDSSLGLVAQFLGFSPLPEAALVRRAQEREPARDAYLAEPVMLSPDRDRLLLGRLGADALDEAETRALVEAAHGHFAPEELRIEAVSGGFWHVRLPGQAAQPGMAVSRAAMAPIHPAPEHFGVDVAGMRILNELQMLWHSHPVNVTRRDAGRLQANALWVWGGGVLPRPPERAALAALATDDTALKGLADWLGIATASPAAMLEKSDIRGLLVVIPPDADELGRRWLQRLARQRGAFELLAAGQRWKVGARRWGWRW